MKEGFNAEGQGEIAVNPPESLMKFEAPLFVGIEPSSQAAVTKAGSDSSKLDDMINALIPPRYHILLSVTLVKNIWQGMG
jgi:hypothetical protein